MQKKAGEFSFIKNTGLLFISILVVNAGNYAINLGLARFLGPESFAEVSILATLVLAFSFIAVCFQISASKFVATEALSKTKSQLYAVVKWFKSRSLVAGFILMAIMLLSTPAIKSYLKFDSVIPLVLLFMGLPIYFLMSSQRGILTGMERNSKLAGSYLIEMTVRLVGTSVLVFVCLRASSDYISEAVALAFLLSFIGSWLISRDRFTLRMPKTVTSVKLPEGMVLFILITGIYEFSQILINNGDLLMVKHYFSDQEAGFYAAIALVGRMVFFATWSVVTLLIPRIVKAKDDLKARNAILAQAMILVSGVGVIIVLVCAFAPNLIIQMLFGASFSAIGPLLWKYAFATALFAAANVFVYFYLSIQNYLPIFICTGIGIIQLAAIVLFNQSLNMVINVQLITMTLLLLSMSIYHIIKIKNHEKIESSFSISVSTR